MAIAMTATVTAKVAVGADCRRSPVAAAAPAMLPTGRYGLEPHPGAYADRPPDSRLCVDGAAVAARVPGYRIEAQYATAHGALLVTSFDCPFEESNAFVLLDARHRVVAARSLLTPYGSWLLHAHWPEDAATLVLHYQVRAFFRLRLLPPARWWPRRPRLRLRPVAAWREDPRMAASHAALRAQLDADGRR